MMVELSGPRLGRHYIGDIPNRRHGLYFSLFLRRKVWSSVTEERLRFVARVPDGEAMTMCAGISAYRARPAARFSIVTRKGQAARDDRSRRPVLATWCYRYVVLPTCPGPDI